MIENIKLKNHKGIRQDVKLEGLGEINIICGKNNSGKSSIMEAIEKKDKHFFGKTFPEKSWKFFKKRFDGKYASYYQLRRRELLLDALNYAEQKIGEITYYDRINDFYKDINAKFRDISFYDCYGRILTIHDDFIGLIEMEELFSFQKPNPILINPKRKLETSADISSYSDVSPTGEGLINKLFYLKNQDPNSEDYKFYNDIYTAFQEITGYYFNIIVGGNKKLQLRFSIEPAKSDKWLPADDCGLGLRDVLIMLYFINDKEHDTILIEEPENHIHPDMQKKLLEYIKKSNKQFFISTHSNIFLNPYYADKIYYTEMTQNGVEVKDKTSRAEILKELGYSLADNISSDLIILVEGPSDELVINKIFQMIGADKYDIAFFYLGGDTMKYFNLQKLCDNFTKDRIFVFVDRDDKSKCQRLRLEATCKKCGVKFHKTKKYAIENYLTPEALIKYYEKDNPELGEKLRNSIKQIDENIKLEDQLKLDGQDKPIINMGKLKKNLHTVFSYMTLDDLKDTDLLEFCKEIKSLLENNGNQS